MNLKTIRCHPFVFSLLMIALGIATGMSHITLLHKFGLFISEAFIRIFRCLSLPIVSLSLLVTLSTQDAEGLMKRRWRKTCLYTLSTTLVAATISGVLYLWIQPGTVQNLASSSPTALPTSIDYFQHVLTFIPTDLFSPFIAHQVITVLILTITLGIAMRHIPNPVHRQTLISGFQSLHSLLLVIIRGLLIALPLGLYGFVTTLFTQMRDGAQFRSIGAYLAIVVLSNLVQGLLILPLWLKWHHIRPFKTLYAMLPALSVAFFSKSSMGTLPITMETAEKRLGLSPQISRFVLPLCTSINMNGCAAFIFTTVLYLMQNHGIPITLSTMIPWIFIATIAAIGNAGVPMGCFFLSASLLTSMDIPITLLGIILPFYGLIDMVETALNVWSDTCVAVMVERMEPQVQT